MYERLSVYKHGIILESLNRFLTVNGFHTRLSDTDAILRRFDHNANQALDYAEFHELCTGQDISEKEEKEEKVSNKAASEKDDKSVKEEIEEVIEAKREEVEMKRQDLDSDAEEKPHKEEDSPEKR